MALVAFTPLRRARLFALVPLIALAAPAVASPHRSVREATATLETEPVVEAGDAIDDPAIWVDHADPSRSVVVAANHGGHTIEVYDMKGRRIQRIVTAGANNVDLRDGFPLGGAKVPLVTAIGGGEMRFYRLDTTTRLLEDVTKGGPIGSTSAHGVCMYHSAATDAFFAFRVTRFGPVDQFELIDDGGQVAVRKVRGFDVDPRPLADGGKSALEACVVDDAAGSLFVVEEEYALWRYGAEPGDPAGKADRFAVDKRTADGGHIVPHAEGLAIVADPHGEGYLIASDQGDDTYNVYRRLDPHQFLFKVNVVKGPDTDGCDRTDGIDVTTANLGPMFPKGMFICQDNDNTAPDEDQNLKYVPLERIVPLSAPPADDPAPAGAPEPAPQAAPPPQRQPTSPNPPAPAPARAPSGGYWMLGRDGSVYAFGPAAHHGNAGTGTGRAVDLEPHPSGDGYWLVTDRGAVTSGGAAVPLGSLPDGTLSGDERVTSLSATPDGRGYWLFTDRGRAVPFGDAPTLGDMSGTRLNGPVLDSVATPSGRGYFMVASDGGIFAFGDARFSGSMGGKPLNAPVQSLVPDADGAGYWLVASDGGVFAFDARFRGSMGDQALNRPVTGMVRYGAGYLMVGEDGGIFNFSDRPFAGSLGARPPPHPIVAVAAVP